MHYHCQQGLNTNKTESLTRISFLDCLLSNSNKKQLENNSFTIERNSVFLFQNVSNHSSKNTLFFSIDFFLYRNYEIYDVCLTPQPLNYPPPPHKHIQLTSRQSKLFLMDNFYRMLLSVAGFITYGTSGNLLLIFYNHKTLIDFVK